METLVLDLLLILVAGLVAGAICRRLGVSMLIGYLVVGGLIGEGGLGLVVSHHNHELQNLAEVGALLLLFAIGIEFSLRELVRLGRHMLVGGSIQMLLVAVPVVLIERLAGASWPASVLYGAAVALSSTVVVFKALDDFGQSATPHGRRAISILLFQDAALVPLLLLIGVVTGRGAAPTAWTWVALALKSTAFVAAVVVLRAAIARWIVPALARMRSTELLILFVLAVVAGVGLAAFKIGLPPALGAFAAGLMLSGNRLTGQIDALVVPYREPFAAVFFVSLGTLMDFQPLVNAPLMMIGLLIAVIVLKAGAAAVALRAIGLRWRAAGGMGLGLAQMGEFSFLLLMAGTVAVAGAEPLVSQQNYARFLLLALGTLVLTPYLLRLGLRWADPQLDEQLEGTAAASTFTPTQRGLIIGVGPIGRQIASQLEMRGVDACLLDLSPVNLQPFAQQGFHTIAGDATEPAVLHRADVHHASLVVVTVPDDGVARRIVRAVRRVNRACTVVVRCRYQASVAALKQLGATTVVSEEAEAGGALLRVLEPTLEVADPP
jgi:CPA2 family monovalent cation:H+ antiporter-2